MSLLSDLLNLNLTDTTKKVIAEYIWIGGSGMDIRSKGKTLPEPVTDPAKLPKWNYDGSSTGQASGEDSEVILYPQAVFRDPLGGAITFLLCVIPTLQLESLFQQMRGTKLKKFSAILMLLLKNLGTV